MFIAKSINSIFARRAAIIICVVCLNATVMFNTNAQTIKPRPKRMNAVTNSEQTKRDVRAVLDAQVAAWNQGDIDGFMKGYNNAPDTIFVSGDTVTRGWQTVFERYKRSYDTREKMGALAFTDLEINALNSNTATALGRWQLTRDAETEPFAKGRFTLIFRRTPAGWRIVHDHTSSAAN